MTAQNKHDKTKRRARMLSVWQKHSSTPSVAGHLLKGRAYGVGPVQNGHLVPGHGFRFALLIGPRSGRRRVPPLQFVQLTFEVLNNRVMRCRV